MNGSAYICVRCNFMEDKIQFKYNKGFAYISGTGLLLLNLWLIVMTYNDTRLAEVKDKLYLFDSALLLILIAFVVKFFYSCRYRPGST